jgi:TonB family protein
MNRLQKKCFFAATGFHLLLLLILFVGPAFFSGNKAQDTQVLTFFDLSKITDGPTTGTGARSVAPPAPAPRAQEIIQPPQPVIQEIVQPPPPKPIVAKPQPPEIEPEKEIKSTERNPFAEKTTKKKIEVSTKLVSRSTTKPKTNTSRENSSQEDSEAKARAEAARLAAKIKSVAGGLKSGFSGSTAVDIVGGSGDGGSVNWRDAVASAYYNAWETPEAVESSRELIAEVTIAANGDVLSTRILRSSGNSAIDSSVQRALNRVKRVAPLPNPKEKQRIAPIVFNPLLKKS